MIKGDAESGHGMLPEVFQQRMRRMLGEEYISFLEAFQRESHHGLRLNPLKTGLDGQSAAEKYGAAQGKASSCHYFQMKARIRLQML